MTNNIFSKLSVWGSSETCKKFDRKPVEDLNGRDKAEAETKSTKSPDVGNEFKAGHLPRSLVFWTSNVQSLSIPTTYQTLWSPRKRGSAPQCLVHKHCTRVFPVALVLTGNLQHRLPYLFTLVYLACLHLFTLLRCESISLFAILSVGYSRRIGLFSITKVGLLTDPASV